jgi:DNA repair exonuclease SbcCD nuclease subunit
MYRILFATDIHFRATKPISRLDKDFFSTILGKIQEIKEMAEHVDLVLLGGDIFDRPDCPHSVVIKVNRAFSNFPCPVYSVIGNHDIFGYEGQTVDATALGSLFEMGQVKRLDALHPAPGIAIYGMHAFDKEVWQVPPSQGTKILVSHKLITTVTIPNCKTFMASDIAKMTNADIVLSGDIHFPHVVTENDKLLVNPGSLSRLSIDDRDRQPQIAIITIDGGEIDCDLKTIGVKPSNTVFDLKAYSERMASEAHQDTMRDTFVHAVLSVKAKTNNVGDVLISFLEKNGVGDKLRKAELEYLARAQKEVLVETQE